MRVLLLGLGLFCTTALATQFQKGFVEIRQDRRLYREYRKAEVGQPTVIFLNGLTWDTRNWQDLVNAMNRVSPEVGVLLYDMVGQGQTLLAHAPVTYQIPLENQVRDLHDLIQHLKVAGPRVVVGLSYGGAVGIGLAAKYPKDFEQMVLMAPFLRRLPEQDTYLNSVVKNYQVMFPYDPRSSEELYDFYLRQLVYTTYPIPEPGLLENPFKLEATFRMVQGSKNFIATDFAKKLAGRRVHFLGAMDDPYVRDAELRSLWKLLRGGASYLRIKDTAHKIPELQPLLSAQWLKLILAGDHRLQDGLTFEIDPIEKMARSGKIEISLEE